MVIITAILLALLVCFGIEFALKVRWLKPVLNCVIIAVASIAAFRMGLETGSTVERFSNASLILWAKSDPNLRWSARNCLKPF